MQRIVAACRQILINRDQVLNVGNLGGKDDLVTPHAQLFGAAGAQKRRLDDRLALHRRRRNRRCRLGVFVHQPGQQFLVERPPVHPDPHRLAISVGDVDQR